MAGISRNKKVMKKSSAGLFSLYVCPSESGRKIP